MALWSRLRQSKLKFHLFSKEFNRRYIPNHSPIISNQQLSSRTLITVLNNHNFINQSSQLEFFCKVRFYAAPVQANQKKEERDTRGPRLNEQITTPFIRLVSDEDHSVVSRYEALGRAKSLNMDLVEVDRHAKPPVCKILDYHKEKYLQQTKEKERAKSKSGLKSGAFKEVRFAAKIKQKDLQMKADMAKRLMESGHRVKCTAIEPTGELDLETLLSRFSALIEDVAVVESEQKFEKKQAFIVVRHVKFGPPKKGSGKKVSKAAVSAQTSIHSSKNQPLEENGDAVEADMETADVDSEELLDEDVQTNKSEWAVFDGEDDIETVFDINDEVNGLPRGSKHEQSAIITGPSPSFADRNPRHVVESAPANTASSTPMGVQKHGMENRYARDARSGNPSRIPTDMNGRGARIPNQGRQPQFSMNASSQMRPPQRFEVPAYEVPQQASSHSSVRNSPKNSYDGPGPWNTMNSVPQVPNQGKQPQNNINALPQKGPTRQDEVPAYDVSKQDSSHSGIPNSPAKSYGIFGGQQVNTMPREQNDPEETNRYKKKDPSDSARSPSTTRVSPQRNPPINRGPDVDNPAQGRW